MPALQKQASQVSQGELSEVSTMSKGKQHHVKPNKEGGWSVE
jgi:hypothetical protein